MFILHSLSFMGLNIVDILGIDIPCYFFGGPSLVGLFM